MRRGNLRLILRILLISIFLLSSILFYYFRDDGRVVNAEVGKFRLVSSFTPSAEIVSSTLFGSKKKIRYNEDPFFSNLITDFWVDYEVKLSGDGVFSGEYVVRVYLEPYSLRSAPGWSKELPFHKKGAFAESGASERIRVDLDYVDSVWRKIQEEIGIVYSKATLVFVSDIRLRGNVEGVSVEKKYRHAAKVYLGKSIEFENLKFVREESVSREVRDEKVFFDGPVTITSVSLKQFSVLTMSGSALLLFLTERRTLTSSIREVNRRRKISSFRRKYGSMIVRVNRVPSHSSQILVNSLEDLGKLAYELEKPILETEDAYCVINENLLFAIKKVNKNEEKKEK